MSILLSIILLVLSIKDAKAIIVVVPIVLIPIVNIVVWIIGALTTPIIALSALFFKIKKKSPVVGVFVGIGLVLLLGILIAIFFKLVNPDRPLY